jgi:hypothetical protein
VALAGAIGNAFPKPFGFPKADCPKLLVAAPFTEKPPWELDPKPEATGPDCPKAGAEEKATEGATGCPNGAGFWDFPEFNWKTDVVEGLEGPEDGLAPKASGL